MALYPSRKKVPVKDLPPFGKIKIKLYEFGIMTFVSLTVSLQPVHLGTLIFFFLCISFIVFENVYISANELYSALELLLYLYFIVRGISKLLLL